MDIQKKFHSSRKFSAFMTVIGAFAVASTLLFAHALRNVRLAANALQYTCSGSLQYCMKATEKNRECTVCTATKDGIKSAACQACAATKAICQDDYNVCTDQGGKIYAW